jgi:hypothetical protein
MKRAVILATPAQLITINIEDTYITYMMCDVSEIDQHENSIGKCSRCTMNLHFTNVTDEYIIPTQWLRFVTMSESIN